MVTVDTTWQFDDAPPEAPLTASVPVRNDTSVFYLFFLQTPKRVDGGRNPYEPVQKFGVVPPNSVVRAQVQFAPYVEQSEKLPKNSSVLCLKRQGPDDRPDPPIRVPEHVDEWKAIAVEQERHELSFPEMSDLVLFDNLDGTLRGRLVVVGDMQQGKQNYLARPHGLWKFIVQPDFKCIPILYRRLLIFNVRFRGSFASVKPTFFLFKLPVDEFSPDLVAQWKRLTATAVAWLPFQGTIRLASAPAVAAANPLQPTVMSPTHAQPEQQMQEEAEEAEASVAATPEDGGEPLPVYDLGEVGGAHGAEIQRALAARDAAETVLRETLQEQQLARDAHEAVVQQLRLQCDSFQQRLQQTEAVRVALEQQLRQAQLGREQAETALLTERQQREEQDQQLQQAQLGREQAETARAELQQQLQQSQIRREQAETALLAERQQREELQHHVAVLQASAPLQALPAVPVLTLQGLQVLRCIAHGSNGIVFEVEWRFCPASPPKRYALKMCFNLGITGTNLVRDTFAVEYRELSLLPPHPNINRFLTAFVDEVSDDVLAHLQEHAPAIAQLAVTRHRVTGRPRRRKCQFFVLELQDRTLKAQLQDWPAGRRITPFAVSVLRDLARASLHCLRHGVLHLDVKTDNVLLEADLASFAGCRALLCDFGCARRFEAGPGDDQHNLRLEAHPSLWHGHPLWGNQCHVCPELLNARGNQTDLDFSGQPVFELGVLGVEILTDEHPLGEYPLEHGPTGALVYDAEAELRERCEPHLEEGQDTRDLFELLRRMIAFDPTQRPSMAEVLAHLERLARPNSTTAAGARAEEQEVEA